MTRSRIFASATILFLTLGACVSSNAQDKRDQNKGQAQKQDKHAAPALQPKRQADQHAQQASHPQNPGNKAGPRAPKNQAMRSPEEAHSQQRLQQRAWQERRANHWEYEHRTWKQRGGYKGERVADDHYQSHFGNAHPFRIYGLPFAYEAGNPRFQYEGYWFTLLDPCPEAWGGRWYETDDVYISYQGDGYYLFNRGYPGPHGVALTVSM
jgi:hypothetical protein